MTRTTEQWEALLDGTTPGPWETHPELSKAIVNLDMKFGVLMVLDEGSPGPENGRLAAAAPDAVAEVIRLREALEVWRGKVKDIPYDGEAITAYITRILEGEA